MTSLNPATRGIPQSLLIQLRAHYPTACLLAELVQVQGDQYVVRAMVNVEGQALATALAAATTVEEAENQARQRVLDVLGIQALILGETPAAAIEPPVAAPVPTPVPTPVAAIPEPLVPDLFSEPAESPTLSKAKRRSTKVTKADAPEPELPPVEISGGDEDMSFEAEFEYSFEEEPVVETPKAKAVAKPPMDLSDTIAQIGAEIDRIGWTKKQGSSYLQETYNKKTRVELTDEELFEFLDYLKSLPAKVQPMMADLPF
ncbi:MAG: hypothetical protein HC860_01450 [Alkalinema sp. RU_4_3]|nr:hypothetical protein [Alkalinema sp. RU_4_3]